VNLVIAVLCQMIAIGLTLILREHTGIILGMGKLIFVIQPVFAALLSRLFRQPFWWIVIHLLFLPSVVSLLRYELPTWIYFSSFSLLIVIFWSTVVGGIPLFLSSSAVSEALSQQVAERYADSLVDLGAGIGSVVLPVAKRCPELSILAIENAPLPWLVLTWRCRNFNNIEVRRSNFWHFDISDYAIIFAFLSPVVMSKLKKKCALEMRHDGVLISSSFEVPDWQPVDVLQLADRAKTKIFLYKNQAIQFDK